MNDFVFKSPKSAQKVKYKGENNESQAKLHNLKLFCYAFNNQLIGRLEGSVRAFIFHEKV